MCVHGEVRTALTAGDECITVSQHSDGGFGDGMSLGQSQSQSHLRPPETLPTGHTHVARWVGTGRIGIAAPGYDSPERPLLGPPAALRAPVALAAPISPEGAAGAPALSGTARA